MLCLSGEKQQTRDSLATIVTPDHLYEKASDRWQPVPHVVLADRIVKEAGRRNLTVASETWATKGPENEDLYFALTFQPDARLPSTKEYEISLAGAHSNRFLRRLFFVSGGRVFICENGMITGNRIVGHKHTTGLNLTAMVRDAFDEFFQTALSTESTVNGLKEIDLAGPYGERKVAEVLVEAGRQNVLPWSGVGKVDRLWREPPHPEFVGRDGWSLYNAFTEALKEYSAPRQIDSLSGARDVILNVVGAEQGVVVN